MEPQKDEKSSTNNEKQKKDNKEDDKIKIHKGIFIADQRRKGKGGRIKSTSIPNKIEVIMSRQTGYLHQSQVQWVEVRRYNKKQGRNRRNNRNGKNQVKQKKPQNNKKLKFKAKQNDYQTVKAQLNVEKKKYMLKIEKQQKMKEIQSKQTQSPSQIQSKLQNQNIKDQGQIISQSTENKVIKQQQNEAKTDNQTNAVEQKKSQGNNNENNTYNHNTNQNGEQNRRKQSDHDSDSDSDSSSQDDHKKYLQAEQLQKKQQKKKQKQEEAKTKQQGQQQGQQANEENDIVIVARIKKQISNPFWKKPFVGIIRFMEPPKNSKKQKKYKQKDTIKSHISQIMDDFYIDFHPIHPRLPVCAIQKSNNSERLLQEYVQKNMKLDETQKGGKIRNGILQQIECLYAQVKFIEWDRDLAYVQLIKIIGKARTIDGQCNCFLYQNQLNDFSHGEQQQIQVPQQLNVSQIHKQYTEMVFTIDPLTSTDLDDALSVTKINQSQYEFGIHISDVSAYLHKIKRQEIARRTTSVYLPHQVFHMLPQYLVNISSLNPNVKRLAFSVFVRINEDGDVISSRLQKNILMSRFKLAYQQAQSIIVNQMDYQQFNKLHPCSLEEYTILVDKIKIMEKIGMAHRKKRLIFQIFDNDQVKFQLDQQKWPINYFVNRRFTAQKIVQQFMIIGNIESAKKSTQYDPQNSLIIHHPKPSDLSIRQFNQYFQMLKYKFKFETSLSLQQDLIKVQNMQNISEDIKRLCFFKARRVQQTATYKRFSQVKDLPGNIHFALGLRHYTHFTSPMRRFADILVHQVLNSLVDTTVAKKQLLDKQIQQANWGRKNTKKLKRDLTEMYLCLMIYRTKKTIDTQGIVSSFGQKSISIFIPLFDMNKQIMWKDFIVDKLFKNKEDQKKLDAVIHYDRKSAKNDVIWVVQKFAKIGVNIRCSNDIPLRLTFELQVQTNFGKKTIKPYQEKNP